MDRIPIVEIFESFQGEGRFMGRRALFIRFAGCNLVGKCLFCDTDFRVRQIMSIEQILNKIGEYYEDGGRLVVFTGGEPSLYQDVILELMHRIGDRFWMMDWQIETNGIVKLDSIINELMWVVVSPKRGFHEQAIRNYLNEFNDFKFVVSARLPEGASTFWTVKDIVPILEDMIDKKGVDKSRIWLMPFGATKEEIEENDEIVWQLARDFGVNYSDRIHVRVWKKSMAGI